MTYIAAWPGQETDKRHASWLSSSLELEPYDVEVASMPPWYIATTDDDDDLVQAHTNEELLEIARSLRRGFAPELSYE
jgi:hypothetical protein